MVIYEISSPNQYELCDSGGSLWIITKDSMIYTDSRWISCLIKGNRCIDLVQTRHTITSQSSQCKSEFRPVDITKGSLFIIVIPIMMKIYLLCTLLILLVGQLLCAPLSPSKSVSGESASSDFHPSFSGHQLYRSKRMTEFRSELCTYLCTNDPGEGGNFCNCDMYPLFPGQ